ncbi:ABC transporter substrate-binding protein [Rhodomicrobium lacus]|uniref:ABC transporter substrate-binding protein n=1 Tax=Rhodomicrobium lacus TaxID=2498452 RepID=UPI000F8CCA4E|nr:ABC transporter substrate-binding protein [Rhodomicrobium lacus]
MRLQILFALLFAINAAAFAGERTVTDDTGRTVTIPDEPKRIVVMHEPLLGVPLMELGIGVVGGYGRTDDGKFVSIDFIDTVLGDGLPKPKGIGPVGQVDLERLLALNPDLIIGIEIDVDKVAQLSTVAPVYLQKINGSKARGIGVQKDLAQLLGRQQAFAERVAVYRARLEAVRKVLPSDPTGKTYLAVFLTDQLNAVSDLSGAIQAIDDLGFTPLKLPQSSASGMGSTLLAPMNPEVFARANPDLLIVMNTYIGARDEAGTRAALDRIVPGWDRFTKPVREGNVVFLDSSKVTTPTVASALHTLDAIEAWAKKKR